LIGTLFAGGVTLALAFAAGAFIGSFVTVVTTNNDKTGFWGGLSGVVIAVGWAIYCLATAATIGAAFLSVLGLIVVGVVILVVTVIICAT
jgi:hypothetical protein